MSQTILAVQRITRIGSNALEPFVLTAEVALKEAGIGRGLLISDCIESRLTCHISYAVRNALPFHSVLIPFSYELSEEIADKLAINHRLDTWRSMRGKRRGRGCPSAPIQLAIPEKLFLIDRRVNEKICKPYFIHVIDPLGLLDRGTSLHNGGIQYRASSVGRHKAVCQANGLNPYLLFWTTKNSGCFIQSHLAGLMGVDAWFYADGRTLRTAAFATLSSPEERSN